MCPLSLNCLLGQIRLFTLAMLVFLGLDLLWLSVIMKTFYSINLGMFARRSSVGFLAPHMPSAFVAYLLLVAGLIIFVVNKAGDNSYCSIATDGALFGAIVYGIYEFTNYSTLIFWSWSLVVVDTIWGAILYAVSSVVVVSIARYFNWM